ncbi:ribonuclease Z [Rurimicrobium arvi]|uniref:Ribonuclease Z n=1 Tax=Rurimicrobium arvi TaxID=2049916 RepID=A0ABP8MGB1_9BACT
MNLKILGNNSALPAYDRYPTCQIADIGGISIMIDCGEGAQILLRKHNVSWHRIRYIFISHLHGDHYFGLPGFLNSMSLLGRTVPLTLFAPAELKPIWEAILDVAFTKLSYELTFVPLPAGRSVLLDTPAIRLESFPVEHRIFCCGLKVTEKSKGRKVLPERCRHYEIPAAYYKQLKSGADYETKSGAIIRNEWVTTEGKPDKVYAYCADTIYTESFLDAVTHVDLLYHESTYLNADAERAAARFHATAAQAAEFAKKAGVKKLLLGHYSSKYRYVDDFQEEARAVFSESYATSEGDEFVI